VYDVALVNGSGTAASVGGMRSNLIFGQCGLTVAAIDRSLAGIAPDQTAGPALSAKVNDGVCGSLVSQSPTKRDPRTDRINCTLLQDLTR